MIALLLATVLAAPPTAATLLEHDTHAVLRREFERVGRRAPVRDPRLDTAARELALRASETDAKRAGDLLSLILAVSAAGAFDPTPRALLLTGPREQLTTTLMARKDLGRDPASHLGIGAIATADGAAMVVLMSSRKAKLPDFPRVVAPGTRRSFCGEVEAPLTSAEVYVTRPNGSVDKVSTRTRGAHGFCADLLFRAPGRHQVEVLASGPQGPEVAALFYVVAGKAEAVTARVRLPEPSKVDVARKEILVRMNALRKAHGVAPLSLTSPLTAIAQSYSERMAREFFFAHKDPAGNDLKVRMREASIPYETAGENLGLADGPLAAHFGIELSPGHRKNLLEPRYQEAGIGIAYRQEEDGRRTCILTEVLSRPLKADAQPLDSAVDAIHGLRRTQKLPPVNASEALNALALEQARAFVRADDPNRAVDPELHEHVFRQLPNLRSAAVDVFIADHPGQVPKSQNLLDPKNRLVGVGAIRGNSKRYGVGRYWVVLIWAR